MAKKKKDRAGKTATIDDLKDPLLAAVGVLDLALEQLNETIDLVRERAEEARSDVSTSAERTREQLKKRRKELREQLSTDRTRQRLTKRRKELREQLSAEELRHSYQSLTERGEAVLVRLRERTSEESDGTNT